MGDFQAAQGIIVPGSSNNIISFKAFIADSGSNTFIFIMNQDEFLTYGNVIIQEMPNRGFVVMVENMPSNGGGGCSGCSGGCDC